jgi:hypothetical protein
MTSTPHQGELGTVADWLQTFAAGLRLATTNADEPQRAVLTAVLGDPDLTVRQRLALKELYTAFREVNRAAPGN